MKKLFFVLLFSLLSVISLSAQTKEWLLDDCIEYALKERNDIKKSFASNEYYNKQYSYSKYQMLPSVNSVHSYTYSNRLLANSAMNEWNKSHNQNGLFSLSSDLVLFNGFRTINGIKQSKINLVKSKTYTNQIQNNIRLEVIQAYYEVLLSKENMSIVESSLHQMSSQIEILKIAVDAGKKSKIDLMELQAQKEKIVSSLIQAQNRQTQAIIKLSKTINYTDTTKLKILPEKKEPIYKGVPDPRTVIQSALAHLPEFEIARLDSVNLELGEKMIKGQYAPSLRVGGSVSSTYQNNAVNALEPNKNYQFADQIKNNQFQQVGLTLSIPIYNNHQVKSQVEQNKLSQIESSINRNQLYNDIYFEIQQLCSDAVKMQENIISLNKRLEYYKEIYDLRNEAYKLGTISIIDLLIAETNKRNAELELSIEKYNLLYNLKLIEFYCGKI